MGRLITVALVGVGLLALGGFIGWTQGYDAGITGGVAATPATAGVGALWGVGFFFKFLLLMFFMVFISKVFFFRRWRGYHAGPYSSHHGGPHDEGHGYWGHGHGHHHEHPHGEEPMEGQEPDDKPKAD
ncbi:MAG: hypothetical protein O2812_05255 [Chloroflexi bacterium]|nr:hypothetical protein [Chloroflexota bacterium]